MQMPVMLELRDRKVLLVGGGPIGFRKAMKLRDYGADVTCVSKAFCESFQGVDGIRCHLAPYDKTMLKGYDIVVAATNDQELNAEIYNVCKRNKRLCMTVDAVNPSDFSFMATAVKDELLIGVSTQGGSPLFAKELVKKLMATVSNELLDQLRTMIDQRKKV